MCVRGSVSKSVWFGALAIPENHNNHTEKGGKRKSYPIFNQLFQRG